MSTAVLGFHVRWIIVASVLVLACSCTPPQVQPFDLARTEAEVREMFEQYGNAQRANGLLGELSFLDTSAAFFWVPPGYTGPISFDSVQAIVEQTAPSLRMVDPRWRALRIEPLNDSMAAYTGELEAMTINVKDDTARTILLETGFVVKRAHGWKLLCGQTTVAPSAKHEP